MPRSPPPCCYNLDRARDSPHSHTVDQATYKYIHPYFPPADRILSYGRLRWRWIRRRSKAIRHECVCSYLFGGIRIEWNKWREEKESCLGGCLFLLRRNFIFCFVRWSWVLQPPHPQKDSCTALAKGRKEVAANSNRRNILLTLHTFSDSEWGGMARGLGIIKKNWNCGRQYITFCPTIHFFLPSPFYLWVHVFGTN